MALVEFVVIVSSWASVCFILLHTDALVEYARLFGLKKWFFIADLDELRKNEPGLAYPTFLLEYHNNFFTRLAFCPACLSFWFSLISLLVIPWWQLLCCYFFILIFYFTLVILSRWPT